jgi:hypothetical protein
VIQSLLRKPRTILKRIKRSSTEWSIASTAGVNVGRIKNSDASIHAEVIRTPITPRLAILNITLKNEGKESLSNLYLMAKVSNGFSLTNSEEIFGASWKMQRIENLAPSQSIKFKLALRSSVNLNAGTLTFLLSPTSNENDPELINLTIPIKTITFE